MNLIDKLHMRHRFWRYRFKSEVADIRFLRQQNLSGKTLLDIGANKGIYSYYMSHKAGKTGRVIAFEPQPELKEHLKDFKTAFGLSNLTVVSTALSDTSGEQRLYRNSIGSGGATFSHTNELDSVIVNKIKLDDYLQENDVGEVSFIKCDVEGHELQVLKGGENTLKKWKPILLFECHHSEAIKGELFSFLSSIGYDGLFFHKGRKFHYSKFSQTPYKKPHIRHRNYVFGSDQGVTH